MTESGSVPAPREVPAEAHTDDMVFGASDNTVNFDAAPWLREASDEDITALARVGWGGDLPADHVATGLAYREYLDDPNGDYDQLRAMFAYLHTLPDTRATQDLRGFECNVDGEAAIGWLEDNRPEVIAKLREADLVDDDTPQAGATP